MTFDEPARADERHLPAHWEHVQLRQVCDDRISVRDPRLWPDDEFCYVDISSIDSSVKRITTPKTMRGRDAPSRARQLIRAGDVLVATTRPNLNAVALVPPALDGQIASTGFCVLRPKEGLDSRYLFAFVQTAEFVKSLSNLVKGALYPAVTDKQVRDHWMPMAELLEQRRIAEMLGEQMATVELARAAVEAQLEAAKALPAAYRQDTFNSHEAKNWPERRLNNLLAQPVKTGISKPLSPAADKRCLTLSAVRDGALDLSASKPVAVSDPEAGGNWVMSRAFYVVRGNGQLRLLGRGGLAPAVVDPPVLYPDLLFQVVTDPDQVDREYLRFVWESDAVRADIERRARTSAGIFKINQANLAEVTLPVPALPEQRRIAARLVEQMQSAEQLRTVLARRLADIETMPRILLRRAFSGEL